MEWNGSFPKIPLRLAFSTSKYQPQQNHDSGLSENVVYPEKPNGFADHYPYEKWLFHWEY